MKTDRRRLLQGAAATGAGLALVGSPLAMRRVDAAEMEELRIGTTALPPQLDPQTTDWIVMMRNYSLIFDTLIRQDWTNGGAFVPWLATGWTQVDDETLEVTLRDDVFFHNDAKLTADDVKYTFERSMQGDARLGVTGIYQLKEMVAVDETTVRFITDGPSGKLVTQLSAPKSSIVPAAYHQEVGYEVFQSAPIGTGPYKLVEFVPDSHLAFERHEQYFAGLPAAKRVRESAIPEVSTRIAALLNGEVDLILDLPPDQVPTIEAGGEFKIDSTSPLNVNNFDIIGLNPPMDKKGVRQAMSLAIDRGLIVEQLLLGNGLHPGGLQSIYDPLYTERAPLAYDPERAKALLAEAGYAGEEIQMVFDQPEYYPLGIAWAEAVAAMWSDVGINVKMVGLEVGQRVEAAIPDSQYHVVISSNGVLADNEISDGFAPTGYYTSFHTPGSLDDVVALFQEAGRTVDPAMRSEIYKQALDIVDDFVPVVTLFTINRVSAMIPSISWKGSPNFGIDLRPDNFSIV
jgi:peptide/nickel transport system substrate-binding protein